MTKYSTIPRQCRRHKFHRIHAETKCYFCYRRSFLNDFNGKKISPEEYLLHQIFGGGRFLVQRPRKNISPRYKGKRPIPSRR